MEREIGQKDKLIGEIAEKEREEKKELGKEAISRRKSVGEKAIAE